MIAFHKDWTFAYAAVILTLLLFLVLTQSSANAVLMSKLSVVSLWMQDCILLAVIDYNLNVVVSYSEHIKPKNNVHFLSLFQVETSYHSVVVLVQQQPMLACLGLLKLVQQHQSSNIKVFCSVLPKVT